MLSFFGMENANFPNKDKKECCTGNNFLIYADDKERITDA